MKRIKSVLLIVFLAANIIAVPAFAQDRKPKSQIEHRHEKEPRERHRLHPRAMRDKDFSMMQSIVKEASFNDKKIDIIRVACISSYFSSRQCAKLLSLISFSNDKLKALEVLAPRLVEVDDLEDIIKEFSFSSDKEKAIKILSRRR